MLGGGVGVGVAAGLVCDAAAVRCSAARLMIQSAGLSPMSFRRWWPLPPTPRPLSDEKTDSMLPLLMLTTRRVTHNHFAIGAAGRGSASDRDRRVAR